MMPAFRQLSATEKLGLVAFLMNKEMKEPESQDVQGKEKTILDEVPYTMTGYNRFTDKNGYPGIKPPWGTLNAINLNNGELLWQVPLGEFEALKKKGITATGTQVYGGPAVTKGGLVFVASTQDEKIRAFDKKTGKVLWEAVLPAAGYATPSIYTLNGRQYIVIACGGGKLGSRSGDQYVAFALKK
jgi:quinoprotein glucose dehydrogenase